MRAALCWWLSAGTDIVSVSGELNVRHFVDKNVRYNIRTHLHGSTWLLSSCSTRGFGNVSSVHCSRSAVQVVERWVMVVVVIRRKIDGKTDAAYLKGRAPFSFLQPASLAVPISITAQWRPSPSYPPTLFFILFFSFFLYAMNAMFFTTELLYC